MGAERTTMNSRKEPIAWNETKILAYPIHQNNWFLKNGLEQNLRKRQDLFKLMNNTGREALEIT